MKVDLEQVKRQYAAMTDDEFRSVRRLDLTPQARECYDHELARRDPARFAAVRQQDVRQAQLEARIAAADAEDPEPKPRFYMGAALGLACLTTVVVGVVAVIRLQHDLAVETQPLLILGGVWMSALTAYMPYWRAKYDWRERRRKEGLE